MFIPGVWKISRSDLKALCISTMYNSRLPTSNRSHRLPVIKWCLSWMKTYCYWWLPQGQRKQSSKWVLLAMKNVNGERFCVLPPYRKCVGARGLSLLRPCFISEHDGWTGMSNLQIERDNIAHQL